MTGRGTVELGETTHRTARNAAVRGLAEVTGKLATLAWTVLAARTLSQEDFGAFSFALALVLLVSALPAWGFDPVMVRRASRDRDLLPAAQAQVLAWQTLLGVPTFLVVGAVVALDRPTPAAVAVLVLVLASGLPELWSDTARAAASACQQQGGVARALVVQRVVTAALVVVSLLAGLGVVGLAAAYLVGTAVGWVSHLRALHELGAGPRWSAINRDGLRSSARGTLLVGLSAVVLVALFRLDAVVLERFHGDATVAVYATAYRLVETVLFVAFAVNQAVLPVMSASSGPDTLRRGVRRGTAAVAAVYAPFAAVCLVEGSRVVGLFFGPRYAEQSGDVLRWLAPTPLLFAVAYLGTHALLARDHRRAMLAAATAATVLNLAMNLALVPAFAGIGAAAATTASYGLLSLVTCLLVRRESGSLRVGRAVVESVAAAAVLAAVMGLMHAPLLLELAAGGTAYALAWWLLVRRFAPEQLEVVRGVLPGGRR